MTLLNNIHLLFLSCSLFPSLAGKLLVTYISFSFVSKKKLLIHMTPTVLSMDDVTSQKGLSEQRSLVQPPAHNMKVRSGCSSKSS